MQDDSDRLTPDELRNRNLCRVITLVDWPRYHDHPSVGGLRWLVFNSKLNGFNKVIRRIGRRILLDEAAYFDWLEDRSYTRGAHK